MCEVEPQLVDVHSRCYTSVREVCPSSSLRRLLSHQDDHEPSLLEGHKLSDSLQPPPTATEKVQSLKCDE